MLLARRIGAVCLVIAAVAVWLLLTPTEKPADSADFTSAIASALDAYETNNSSADSAPQQQVVNGWAAKDLLEVIARAQNAVLSPESAPRDDRVAAYLLLVVLGLALLAFTTERTATGRPTSTSPSA